MNKEQLIGTVRTLTGRLQQQAGQWLGSREQQALGLRRLVLGRAEKSLGDAHARTATRGTGHGHVR